MGNVSASLEVSADNGATWEKVTKLIKTSEFVPANVEATECDIRRDATATFGNGGGAKSLAYLKRFGWQYWHLPVRD